MLSIKSQNYLQSSSVAKHDIQYANIKKSVKKDKRELKKVQNIANSFSSCDIDDDWDSTYRDSYGSIKFYHSANWINVLEKSSYSKRYQEQKGKRIASKLTNFYSLTHEKSTFKNSQLEADIYCSDFNKRKSDVRIYDEQEISESDNIDIPNDSHQKDF